MRSRSSTARRSAVAVGAVCAVLLAGCGGAPGAQSSGMHGVRVTRVDDRALLTHRPASLSDLALLEGPLGTNSSGCITIGGSVVVLPSDDVLLDDGQVRRNGTTFAQGQNVRLGGGHTPVADAVRAICGNGDYFIAGSR